LVSENLLLSLLPITSSSDSCSDRITDEARFRFDEEVGFGGGLTGLTGAACVRGVEFFLDLIDLADVLLFLLEGGGGAMTLLVFLLVAVPERPGDRLVLYQLVILMRPDPADDLRDIKKLLKFQNRKKERGLAVYMKSPKFVHRSTQPRIFKLK